MSEKTYLGDSVYAEDNGDMIRLTTNSTIAEDNVIYLEPQVFEALIQFAEKIGWIAKPSEEK